MPTCLPALCLQGHGLIEAVVEQQARQPAAHTDSRHGARTAGFLGGLRGWAAGSSLQDDSDDEAAGGLAGTFVGGDSPGLLGSRSAMSSVAAAPTAEAAAHLAALHAAAASVHAAPFTELLSRIVWVRCRAAVLRCACSAWAHAARRTSLCSALRALHMQHLAPAPLSLHLHLPAQRTLGNKRDVPSRPPALQDGKQRERGLQAATGAMAAASEARGVALTREAGYLVLHLLPMSDEMAAAAAGGAGVINTEEIEQASSLLLLGMAGAV